MIPKKIHYCWFGGSELPEKDKKCIESWKKYCPDYEIIRWDESNYDISKNRYMFEAYEAKKWGFVPDYARLDIIYNNGGIYLDTDVELVRNIDVLLELKGYMGFECIDRVNPGLGFGAEKGLPIIKEIMDSIYADKAFKRSDGSYDTTPSPKYNSEFLIEKGLKANGTKQVISDLTVLPIKFLCPIDFETGELKITSDTISIHWFNASWLSDKDKRRINKMRRIKKIFGKKIGTLIEKILNFPTNFKYHTKEKGLRGAFKYYLKRK